MRVHFILDRSGLPDTQKCRQVNLIKKYELLTKPVRSRWLDIGLVLSLRVYYFLSFFLCFFYVFMDRDRVEVHKLARTEKEAHIKPSSPNRELNKLF